MGKQQFRRSDEIQGIRGFAVLVVVLDHALGAPTGGFLGVDVFFVISGFVIARGLIAEHARTGSIDLVRFARRRFKRLAPAASVVIVVTLTIATQLRAGGQRLPLVIDAGAASLGWANWRFASQHVDYFSRDSLPSPFQHFWSLGVEEQFYVALPIITAMLLGKRALGNGRRWLTTVMAAFFVSSLVWALLATSSDPTSAYFATQTRAWELLAGVLLAILPERLLPVRPWFRTGGTVVGTSLLVLSVTAGRPDAGAPAPLAIVPVVGCALVIMCTVSTRTAAAAPLRSAPLVRLGDVSYSLYLWHWPVVVLLPQLVPAPPIISVIVSALLGWASMLLVERPRRGTLRGGFALTILSANVIGMLFAANRVAPTPGVPLDLRAEEQGPGSVAGNDPALDERRAAVTAGLRLRSWPPTTPSLDDVSQPGHRSELVSGNGWGGALQCGRQSSVWTTSSCEWGPGDGARALVVGDSTAVFEMPAWHAAASEEGSRLRIRAAARIGCPFIDLELASAAQACDGHNQRVVEHLKRVRYDTLIITNRFWTADDPDMKGVSEQDYSDAVRRQVESVRPFVRSLVIVPPPPPGPPFATCRTSGRPLDCAARTDGLENQLRALQRAAPDSVVDLDGVWCVARRCPAVIDGVLTRIDTTHASPEAAAAAGPALVAALRSIDAEITGDSRQTTETSRSDRPLARRRREAQCTPQGRIS